MRDIGLPPEYAKGLEGLLVKAQENDRLAIEMEMKQKMVRTAELEGEAEKMRHIKQAEGRAHITVLDAKAQADAMQHTLPLKEKQIQQTRLEAEARKEATIKNAEAAAAAKVIDSKAELEKRNLMAQAEAQRIRLLAGSDAERMRSEAQVLKDNPLLIQKIIAERLSDKVQIMMVPTDGKFFFANDVLKGSPLATSLSLQSNELSTVTRGWCSRDAVNLIARGRLKPAPTRVTENRDASLSIVGAHGRKSSTLVAVCIVPCMWMAPLASQAPAEYQDLLPELAARIAAIVAPDSQVLLAASAPDSTSSAARRLQEALVKLLASRRVRVVDAGDSLASVAVSCSENLRERSCVATVQRDSRRDAVIVTRPHDGTRPRPDTRPQVSLELQSLFTQTNANPRRREYRRSPARARCELSGRVSARRPKLAARVLASAPAARAWPRDLRGRLQVDDDRFVAFLPGVACAGRLNRAPWNAPKAARGGRLESRTTAGSGAKLLQHSRGAAVLWRCRARRRR